MQKPSTPARTTALLQSVGPPDRARVVAAKLSERRLKIQEDCARKIARIDEQLGRLQAVEKALDKAEEVLGDL